MVSHCLDLDVADSQVIDRRLSRSVVADSQAVFRWSSDDRLS